MRRLPIAIEAFLTAQAFGYYYISGFFVFLWFVYTPLLFILACFGAWQMKSLKAAGERLARGGIDEKIDTKHMYWEFKRHAENLNSIGEGMAAAVEQRMKSNGSRPSLSPTSRTTSRRRSRAS